MSRLSDKNINNPFSCSVFCNLYSLRNREEARSLDRPTLPSYLLRYSLQSQPFTTVVQNFQIIKNARDCCLDAISTRIDIILIDTNCRVNLICGFSKTILLNSEI